MSARVRVFDDSGNLVATWMSSEGVYGNATWHPVRAQRLRRAELLPQTAQQLPVRHRLELPTGRRESASRKMAGLRSTRDMVTVYRHNTVIQSSHQAQATSKSTIGQRLLVRCQGSFPERRCPRTTRLYWYGLDC